MYFLHPPSLTEVCYFLFKLFPLFLACMAFECLLLLGTSSVCCHAYFILLPGLCTVIAWQRDDSFFAGIIIFAFSVLTYMKRSVYLHGPVMVFYLHAPSLVA